MKTDTSCWRRPCNFRRGTLWLASLLCATAVSIRAAEDAVLTVNHTAVTREEFVFFMAQERSQAMARATESRAAKPFNESHARNGWKAFLQQKTVERITREKIRQQLFQELGLIDTTGFGDFLKQLEAVNHEREQAANSGQAVYGPVHFSPRQFYDDRMAKLELLAKNQLATGKLAVTEDEARGFYKKNHQLFRTTELSDWEILTVESPSTNSTRAGSFARLGDEVFFKMTRTTNSECLRQELSRLPDIRATWEKLLQLDNDRLGELCANENDFNRLVKLKTGRCIKFQMSPDKLQIFRRVARIAPVIRPFEEVSAAARNKVLDQKYAALLAGRCKEAEVMTNHEVLNSIAFP